MTRHRFEDNCIMALALLAWAAIFCVVAGCELVDNSSSTSHESDDDIELMENSVLIQGGGTGNVAVVTGTSNDEPNQQGTSNDRTGDPPE